MDFGPSAELQKIWLKYLNLPLSEEKKKWLDLFLGSYLQILVDLPEEQRSLFRHRWKSIGNILLNCFLKDLYKICYGVFLSNAETGKLAYSDPLRKYLLEGRGWKLLWVIENVGIESLTSTKELTSVLTKLIPVVLIFPVSTSTIPESLKRKKISPSLETCFFRPTRERKSYNIYKPSIPSKKISKLFGKSQSKREKLRHRTEQKRLRQIDKNVSNSSDEDVCGYVAGNSAPLADGSCLEKTLDIVASTIISPVPVDENESNDDESLESLLNEQKFTDFDHYIPSAADWVDFSLDFLHQVALLEHHCFYRSSPTSQLIPHFVSSSPLILQFAFDTLRALRDDEYHLNNWDSETVHKLHNQVLLLVFTSASLLINLDNVTFLPDESELIRTLLLFSSDITNCNSPHRTDKLCTSSIQATYSMVLGTLMLIYAAIRSANEDCSRIIHTIRNFTGNGGVNICCTLISYLERNNGIEVQCPVFKILCVIKDIIMSLKMIRGQLSHHSNCIKPRHLTCKASDFCHHHDDVLGSSLSHSILNTEPVCSIAAMCHLLLKIYTSSDSKTTMKDVIILIRAAGICCCLDLSLMLTTIYHNFHTLDSDLQHLVLSVVEKTVFYQMGLTLSDHGECIHCIQRLSCLDDTLYQNFDYSGMLSSDSVSREQAASRVTRENKVSWNALRVYANLLHSESLQNLHQVAKHIAHLVASGKECFKNMLFLNVILPEFLLVSTGHQEISTGHQERPLSPGDYVRIECFLSVLPSLLSHRTLISNFMRSGGILVLYKVLLVPKLQKLALKVLEILIIKEITLQEKFNDQRSVLNNSAVLTEFSNILYQCSAALLKALQTNDARSSEQVATVVNQTSSSGVEMVKENSSISADKNLINVLSVSESSNQDLFGGCNTSSSESLSFIGDLWHSFKDLVIQSQCNIISEEVLLTGYDLLLTILRNLFTLSRNHPKDSSPGEEPMKNVFHLLESLLTVFLFLSHGFHEKIPGKLDLIKCVKQTVEENEIYDIHDLEMLLETFLSCSLQSAYVAPDGQNLQVPLCIPKKDSDYSIPMSDLSEHESDSLYDTCEADSETSSGNQWNCGNNGVWWPCSIIQHTELLKLSFELLMYFRKNFDSTEWTKVASNITNAVTQMCSSCVTNEILLGKKGMATFLLFNFHDVLEVSESNLKDLQKSILHLFSMIAAHSMCPKTIREFISLLKSPSAPLGTLLNGFQSVVDSAEACPPQTLVFPCKSVPIKTVRSELAKIKSVIHTHNQYTVSKDVSGPCAWKSTAVIFPLTVGTKWNPFKRGFSFTLWLILEPLSKHGMCHLPDAHNLQTQDIKNECCREDDHYRSSEVEIYHVLSLGSGDILLEVWVNAKSGDVILRMNSYQKSEIKCMSEATWKGLLTPGSWHHFALNYTHVNEKKLTDNQIQIIINGIKLHKVSLKHGQSSSQKNTSSHILLGHSVSVSDDQKRSPSYHLGGFMLFREAVLSAETAYYLASLGPTVVNLTECALQHRTLFFPRKIDKLVFSSEISPDVITGIKVPCITQLQENLLLAYRSKNPMTYFLYDQPGGSFSSLLSPFTAKNAGNLRSYPDEQYASQQHPIEYSVLVAGELVSECHSSFYSSIHHNGGIRVFLFLLARVIEVSDQEEVQADALKLLLKLVLSDYNFADDFLHMNGMQLLEQLFLREKCIISHHFLEVFLNHCIISKNPTGHSSSQKKICPNDAVITNPFFLSLLMKCVVRSKNIAEGVFVSFFQVLQMLLCDDNPNMKFNIQQMSFVHLLDSLIYLLKEKYLLEDNGHIPLEASLAIAPIVKKLLIEPVNVEQTRIICDFLLLLHKSSSTYVCHARKSFYFLFPVEGFGTFRRSGSLHISSSKTSADVARYISEEWEEIETVCHSLKGEKLHSAGKIIDNEHETPKESCLSNLSKAISMSDGCLHKSRHSAGPCDHVVQSSFGSVKSLDVSSKHEKSFSTKVLSESVVHPASVPAEVVDFQAVRGEMLLKPEMEDEMIEPQLVKRDLESVTSNSPEESLVTIVIGFLKILQDLISEKMNRTELFSEIFRPELFIVLAHNPCDRICAEAIRVLNLYLLKSSDEERESFLQMKGFHLLATQLQQFSVSPLIAEACFLAVHDCLTHDGLKYDFSCPTHESLGTEAWVPLLSLLPKTYEDVTLCGSILSALSQVLSHSSSAVMDLLNQGLCECLVHLLLNISHITCSETEYCRISEQKPLLDSIKYIFQILANETFSSEDANSYSAYCNIVYFMSAIEVQSTEECGPSATCISNIRDIQCTVFQSAIDFTDSYINKYCKPKNEEISGMQNSIWDVLLNLPEAVNPYSTITSTAELYVTDFQESPVPHLPEDFVYVKSESPKTHIGYKEPSVSEVAIRFQFLMMKSTDFVVFADPCCLKTVEQELFHRRLLHFMTKGLYTLLDESGNIQKLKFRSTVWSIKDTLKSQLSRLVVVTLSPTFDLKHRCYATEVLANQAKCSAILNLVSSSPFSSCCNVLSQKIKSQRVTKMEKNCNLHFVADFVLVVFNSEQLNEYLLRFLCDLNGSKDRLSQKQKNDLNVVLIHLNENLLKSVDSYTLGECIPADQFHENWIQLWSSDRAKWIANNFDAYEKVMVKYEKLSKQISDVAVDVTKNIMSLQNGERKKFMQKVKDDFSTEVLARTSWFALSDQMCHERSVWYIEEAYPCSWELDPTEGPQRIRRRLRRCHLNIEPRFLLPDSREKLDVDKVAQPLSCLFEFKLSDAVSHNVHTHEKIGYTCPCKMITSTHECEGEILLCDMSIIFVGMEVLKLGKELSQRLVTETWQFEYIKEILPRRFELQNSAFEIFMTNGLSHLVAFKSVKDMKYFWERLKKRNLPFLSSKESLPSLLQLWRDKSITNFEYLIQLNKLAGRSFNDLMQYPVFPFILSDYSSLSINLMDPGIYRNLAKPVAVQHKHREEYYINAYNCLKDEKTFGPWTSSDFPMSSAYHYGSHYSNSGTVLHFLIRLLPFTYSFITYQDNNFDIPDRSFHSVDTAWQLVSKESTSDVKELIPEFFFLPEFLLNKERFNFGIRQNGERVDDVTLPPWCKRNPRLFIFIHRQALESNHVTNNLNSWIDLVFGYKQTGKAAIDSVNVFHPATYFGLDITKVQDPISRKALHAMIKTVGQMPQQLFFHPHPMVGLSLAQSDIKQSDVQHVVDTVEGLRWGDYVGSPSTEMPRLLWLRKQPSTVGYLLSVLTNDVFGLPLNICLLLSHSRENNVNSATYIMSAALISWGHKDGVVRIKISRGQSPIPLLQGTYADPVCLCSSVPDCKELFVAHVSGIIYVYNLSIDSKELSVSEKTPRIQLNGHSGPITCIYICKAFSIVVSASEDKSCIIWDLNKLCYIRSICDHAAGVNLTCVSGTLGDIASVSNNGHGSCLKVHTINGDLVGRVDTMQQITAVCYSSAPEGISVNVIATGMSNGSVRLWSSWDLKPVREIKSEKYLEPIQCLTFSADNQHLYAANVDGTLAVWEKPSKGLSNMPRFLMFD